MTHFDEQQHRAAYDALAKGDTEPLFARVADDYVQHMTAWNLTVHGRERTRELVERVFERMQITDYRLVDVLQHGEFVINLVAGRSALREDEFQGVDVLRPGPDGLAVEGWAHRPPLPDGVDVRQLLDWHD
jgi:ketosteroid isomerase-like protein